MNIKNTLFSFLSFGEDLKKKKAEDLAYTNANKLCYGPAVVKSSLAENNLKAFIVNLALNTLPFAVVAVALFALLTNLGQDVLEVVRHFGAGMVCYFAFILIELIAGGFNHAKKHKILKPTLIIAAATFFLTCGTVIRELYHIISSDYLSASWLDVSALPIIFSLIIFAILTDGEPKLNKDTLIATTLSVLFVASNIRALVSIPFMVYIKLAILAVMLVLAVLKVVKQNKGLKIKFKTPLVIFGVTAGVVLIIALVLRFVFGDINEVKFALSTAFAGVFSGDVTSVALLENTIGGGAVTNNSALYGIMAVIAYILPGSFLVNNIAIAGFNMGRGENALPIGILYAVMGIVIVVGVTLSVVSLYIEFIKAGGENKVMVTVKRYVTASVLGAAAVTILALISSFVNLLRVSFGGVFAILFAASLIAIIYVLAKNYKVNKNILAVLAGVFTVLVMVFSSGVAVY